MSATNFAQKIFTTQKDIFGTRVFVENKGQFNSTVNSNEKIRFAYESAKERIYFTDKGLVYKLIKRYPAGEEQMERAEKGKKVITKPDKVYYVKMNWLNANENIQIVESEKQKHYFTYGAAEFNSQTFKKITFKNVYNNIDIEYVMSAEYEHGIKYNVILHPGADPTDVKIAYTGDIQKIKEKKENIVIKTRLEDITEHAPQCYYEDGTPLVCKFKLEKNIISFSFPQGISNNKKVIIDPWVTTITTLLPDDYGFDVDHDGGGNLFVYGGINQIKVAKYDPLGVLIWTFSGNIPGISWTSQGVGNEYIGNFMVDKINGKVYLGQAYEPASGARIVRLDDLGNYDNFVTPILFTVEVWDFAFHCPTATVYELGGATITNLSAGIVNPVTGTVNTANFTGIPTSGQDILSGALDSQNNLFAILSSNGTAAVDNKMMRINNAFNGNVWMQPSTYTTFFEANNKVNYVGGTFLSQGFNCLAVNDNYLFYYDGFNLAAYNKNTGVKIAFTTIPVHAPLQQGGIAVDDCNNLYIGSIDNLLSYNFNGLGFTPLASIPLGAPTPNKFVYDIKLAHNSKLLYVSGSGFAGVYTAANSVSCGTVSPFGITSNCLGFNSAEAVATLTMGIGSPTISYIWINQGGNTVATTMSTTATSNTVSLPNGTYTLQTQVNSPCGPWYTNTINIQCCTNVTVNTNITQATCANAINSASLVIAGGGTLTPTVTWTPPPVTVGPGSLTASGLPIGTSTVTVNHGFGCTSIVTLAVLPPPPAVTFTINNLTGSNSITCTYTSVNLQAVSNYTFGTLSYSWTSPSFTANTSTVNISAANTLTVTAIDPATGCFQTQTISIGSNVVLPTNSVNPVSQFVSCNSGAPATFSGTVISPTINIQHDWYSPLNPLPFGVPIATSNNTISILSGVIPPGIYTLQTTDLVSGCKAIKTITITSLDAWPTFSVSSSTNYSIGCSPLNQTTINILNPQSTQSPSPATCSFTFLPPGFAGVVSPSVVLGGNTSTITQLPGTWTVIVQDNSNYCRTILSIPIIQNTFAPNVSAIILTQTLTCYNPKLLATGTSSTPNTVITWGIPVAPNQLSTPTVEIGPASGPNTNSTSLIYANYTVIATNTINACLNTSVVVINQNFKPPISSPTISIGTPTSIYCNANNNPVILTTGASTTTSGGGPLAYPVPVLWRGPSPQLPIVGASSYSAFVVGIYTLTIMDNYNGCTNTGTINVLDKTQPPVITQTLATSILDCGNNSGAILSVVLTGTNSGIRNLILTYPPGAAFSPSSAIISNVDPNLSGTSSSSITVSKTGLYHYVVTNTLTGCQAFGDFNVVNGVLTASFMPDVLIGFPPLAVNFSNNSYSSLSSNSITSVWSFGNGTSKVTTDNSNTSTIYSAPGSYTVVLITSKGGCLDTAYNVIKVEMPSKLESPNVFTPNGDGSNDVFFLKTANLGAVNAVIFDRWGNKVYDVNSSTGNIAWDGKNFGGKECAAGVYFYVIKAKGNDGKEFEVKGNVTLIR